MAIDPGQFKFRTEVTVRNYEVDWQGIVHNAVYLLYFETGRIAYLQLCGVPINHETIRNESRIVVARNEIDYRSPATFGQVLEVFTRVASIGDSSFVFEGLIIDKENRRILVENRSVLVWLGLADGRPSSVPEGFRGAVARIEGRNPVQESGGKRHTRG